MICRIDIVAPTTALEPSGSGSLPVGSAEDIETAKAEFKSAWEALKGARTRAGCNRSGFGSSELVHLGTSNYGRLLDGLLSREQVRPEAARDEIVPVEVAARASVGHQTAETRRN